MEDYKCDYLEVKKCKEVRGRPEYIGRDRKANKEVSMVVGLVIAALGLGIAAASAGGDGK